MFVCFPGRRRAPIPIPTQEASVTLGQVLSFGHCLGTFALGVIVIARTEQPSAARRRFNEHPAATRSGWAIRDAMLNNMDIKARPKRARGLAPHLPSTLHYFFNTEVELVWMFTLQ